MGPNINQDSGNNGLMRSMLHHRATFRLTCPPGSFAGTSNMLISNISFVNFTGFLDSKSSRTAQISCSSRQPCHGIRMEDIRLRPTERQAVVGAQGTCKYIVPGGVVGMTGNGC